MLVLHCTSKLRERLKPEPLLEVPGSTTLLGDWYCHLLRFGRNQVILCVSETTRLPIFIPAREAQTFPLRLRETLRWVLTQFQVAPEAIATELSEMAAVVIAPTTSRSVLGSLNDFQQMARYYVATEAVAWDLLSLRLAQTPCRPLNYDTPEHVTKRRFHVG